MQGMNPMVGQLPPQPMAGMPAPPVDPATAAAMQAQGLPCPTCGAPDPNAGCPSCDPAAQLMSGPVEQSVDPNSLAGVIQGAIQQARAAGHAQLDDLQDQAAQQAQASVHPIVQAMGQQAPPLPMRGMAGGSLPPMMSPPGQSGPGY